MKLVNRKEHKDHKEFLVYAFFAFSAVKFSFYMSI